MRVFCDSLFDMAVSFEITQPILYRTAVLDKQVAKFDPFGFPSLDTNMQTFVVKPSPPNHKTFIFRLQVSIKPHASLFLPSNHVSTHKFPSQLRSKPELIDTIPCNGFRPFLSNLSNLVINSYTTKHGSLSCPLRWACWLHKDIPWRLHCCVCINVWLDVIP